ncbi:MBL fold metallo-hydrolase [Sinorhizobium medicae]|uniref:MBL fold metallo-hydrolase n=1 Tax=Sinorhizobium medicae TaxID=110321 RepID=UPI002AF6B21B|nr:MBL fold metallo-hydrolase [Sinorhizobium medicae]WQO91967.1 MBL fold metallo-hydrolase [Sinorhizobium medicae]
MKKSGNPYHGGPVSDHFDGLRFYNPGGTPPRGLADLLHWQFGGGRVAWPARYDSPFPQAKPELSVAGDRLRVTMVGHATLLIQVAGINILTDPVWSRRASPFTFAGPLRRNAPGVLMSDLPPIDLVLVTHNHYDHLDIDTLSTLHAQHAPQIITPLGNDAIIRRSIPNAEIRAVDWGDRMELEGAVVHAEPCHHWSVRHLRDRRMALWAAFVIETPAGKIYHVGDTGFHDGINYRAAREKHGGFRIANLPFGSYEPRWFMASQHQNPEEAVMGMVACGAEHAAGHHWGTFRLTNEGVEEPLRALETALDGAGIERSRFRALRPGEVFDVPASSLARE